MQPIKQSSFPLPVPELERFNELLSMYPPVQHMLSQGELKLPTFKSLLYNIWLAFYCPTKVNLNNEDNVNSQYLHEILQSEQYAHWCQFTKYDDLFALITTLSIAENILKEWLKQERFQQLSQSLGVGQHEHQFQPYLDNINMNALIEQSKKSSTKLKEAMISLHSIDGKLLHEIPLREQLKLAHLLEQNETLKKIAELTGRFKRIFLKTMKTKQQLTIQHQHIAFGQELERLLPVELAGLILPQSKHVFYRKFIEHEMMVFDRQGKEQTGKGPIVICMDESSSMTSLKEESKAFCLALLMIAKKQKRDFAIIPFATNVGEVTKFNKGQATLEEMTTFSTSFLGGGTNYERALQEALAILNESQFKYADLLFVTDGTSFLSTSFLESYHEVKRKKGFNCTSIVLTNLYNAVDKSLVNKFSDEVIEANDLFSADQVFNTFF